MNKTKKLLLEALDSIFITYDENGCVPTTLGAEHLKIACASEYYFIKTYFEKLKDKNEEER